MKRIIEKLAPGGDNNSSMGLSNKSLIERIAKEFETELQKASTDDKVLFPMSFTILLHPDDYTKISDYFAPVTQSIVKRFYKIIRKNRGASFVETYINKFLKKKSNCKDVTPIGYNWEFILTKTTVNNVGGFQVGINNPAFVISATARVYGNNTSETSSTKVSVSCLNSNPSESKEINIETLKGINLMGDNHYLIAFNNNLVYSDQDIDSSDKSTNYGTLQYKGNGKIYTFTIKDEIVSISGINDERTQRSIFKIPTSELKNDHVQIKVDLPTGKYYISTIADDTRLNQGIMAQSLGTPNWIELPNNSEILIRGKYSVKFNKQ